MDNKSQQILLIIQELTEQEQKQLIAAVPKQHLIEHIKRSMRNKKSAQYFAKHISGKNLDLKSRLLADKLPDIFFKTMGQDWATVNHVAHLVRVLLTEVDRVLEERGVTSAQLEGKLAPNILLELLDVLKLDFVEVYFKLKGLPLSETKRQYIQDVAPVILEVKNVMRSLEKQHVTETQDMKRQLQQEYEQKEERFNEQIEACRLERHLEREQIVRKEQELMQVRTEHAQRTAELEHKLREQTAWNKQREQSISEMELLIQEHSAANQALTIELSLQHNEFAKLAEERWQQRHATLVGEARQLEQEYLGLIEQKESLHQKIAALQEQVTEWEQAVENYWPRIEKRLIDYKLDSMLLGQTQASVGLAAVPQHQLHPVPKPVYMKEGEPLGERQDCVDLHDFAQNLADNLYAIGIGGQAIDLSQYMISIVSAGLVPVVAGIFIAICVARCL